MSEFGEVCDHLAGDLKANVKGLHDAIIHTRTTWDPTELQARKGERHLAIWPAPEAAVVEPFAIGSHRIRQAFAILYWEPAPETRRGKADVEMAERLFSLHDEVVSRLYEMTNQLIGSGANKTWKVWYDSSALPERSGDVRWFAVGFTADREKHFV
jgi:hypothetical protein